VIDRHACLDNDGLAPGVRAAAPTRHGRGAVGPLDRHGESQYLQAGDVDQYPLCGSDRRSRLGRATVLHQQLSDIGLWGEKIRTAYAQMGILGFAETNLGEVARRDEHVAEEFDARRAEIERVANSVVA
jgi:hypothetical protein